MPGYKAKDKWDNVVDLDGLAHYKALGISKSANADAIKKAYRECARKHHPDKGGNAEVFANIQTAFEILSNPQKRAVYDEWAKEVEFRYVPGVTPKAQGGEDMLLDEFEGLGLHCEPRTQLVVLCEVCRRPSTKECWTCRMKICDFCTLKRHWKGTFQLHWPLINSDHMRVRLAQRELEQKRIEDGNRMLLQDPNARTIEELKVIRAFKVAATKMLAEPDYLTRYSLALARFYMWAQTPHSVMLAVFIPTGYQDKELTLDCTETTLRVQPQGSPPVIHRLLGERIDASSALETCKTEDNRCLGMVLTKKEHGEHWRHLFQGDPDGARCMQPPYTLYESETDNILEIKVPFWIDAEDVFVKISPNSICVDVRNELDLQRTCWQNTLDEDKSSNWQAIDPAESVWCLDEAAEDREGEPAKSLMITLARPAPTESEITWKKGTRQDNRVAERAGMHKRGYRFFEDDEDEYRLEDLLQALCFLERGETWVPAKPWETGSTSAHIRELNLLPTDVQKLVHSFMNSSKES